MTRPRFAEDLRGRSFALLGTADRWPSFHPEGPTAALQRRGAVVHEAPSETVDYVVVFPGRKKGRAAGVRKAESLAARGQLELLDTQGLVHLLRPELGGATFAFVGGFDTEVEGVPESAPPTLAGAAGGVVAELGPEVDYVVVGPRRAKGKTAALRRVREWESNGARFSVLDEHGFLELIASQAAPRESRGLADLVIRMRTFADSGRLKRALKMLQAESFQLYLDVTDEHLVGIVKSQTGHQKFYSTRLHASGDFWCCSPDLAECMGLQGRICKHLLVLALGAVQTGEIEASRVETWLGAASRQRPKKEEQAASDTILRYRSAEAGELDWRPTETMPEDFYAL